MVKILELEKNKNSLKKEINNNKEKINFLYATNMLKNVYFYSASIILICLFSLFFESSLNEIINLYFPLLELSFFAFSVGVICLNYLLFFIKLRLIELKYTDKNYINFSSFFWFFLFYFLFTTSLIYILIPSYFLSFFWGSVIINSLFNIVAFRAILEDYKKPDVFLKEENNEYLLEKIQEITLKINEINEKEKELHFDENAIYEALEAINNNSLTKYEIDFLKTVFKKIENRNKEKNENKDLYSEFSELSNRYFYQVNDAEVGIKNT